MRGGETSACILPANGRANIRICACMGPLVIFLRETLPLFLAFLREISSASGQIGNIISIYKLRRGNGISLEKTRGYQKHFPKKGLHEQRYMQHMQEEKRKPIHQCVHSCKLKQTQFKIRPTLSTSLYLTLCSESRDVNYAEVTPEECHKLISV